MRLAIRTPDRCPLTGCRSLVAHTALVDQVIPCERIQHSNVQLLLLTVSGQTKLAALIINAILSINSSEVGSSTSCDCRDSR